MSEFIFNLQRFAKISNSTSDTLVSGTSSNDSISNNGSNVSISGGAGNDTIMNRGNLATILGGEGDDYVNMSDNGGKGGVYVYTGGNDTVIADYWALNTIVLGDVSVESSVKADDGHGTLYLSNGKTLDVYPALDSWHVRLVSSMDEVLRVNTVVDNGESFVSLTGANQEGTIDLIANWGGSKVTINGDTSNYWVLNTGTFGKITTGTSNDTIFNWGGNKSTISTGAGDDDISNSASNVSINSGTGDDFIENRDGNSNVTVDAGDGNDDIYDEWGESNILIGGAGNDNFNAGKNSTVYAGSGNDRVDHPNYGGKVFLEDGDDLFYAYGETIHDDGTTLRSEDYFVDGGAGDDNFVIYGGNNATINGGTGDDFIKNIDGANLLITYTAGDGNDYIQGFNSTSTLQIGGTGTYSTQTSSSDVIVTVGEGKITLQGAATLSAVNIKGTLKKEEGLMTINKTTKKSIAGTAQADEIFNYANTVTLKGGAENDLLTTMRKTSGVKLYGEAGDDTLEAYNSTKVLLSGGEGNDEIYIGGGSNVTAIGGAGDDSIEIDNSAKALVSVSAAGDGNDLVEGFNSTSTLKIGNGSTDTYSAQKVEDDVIVTVGDGKVTLSGAASLWVATLNDGKGGLKNIKGTFSKIIKLTDDDTSPVTLDASFEGADASARSAAIKIVGNALDNSILGGKGKDSLYGKDSNDTLDGGAGDDYLSGGAGNDVFIFGAGKDTIADYVEGEDVVSISGSGDIDITTSVSGNNGIVKIGSNTLTIKNAKFKTVNFTSSSGDDFDLMFGKETLDNSSPMPHTAGSGIWITDASARTTASTITGNALDNTITGGTGKDVIKGGDGSDSIFGGKGNDKLYGNGDEDTLWGGLGNDTLIGGEDDDLFVYTGGKDLIYDYVEGEDKISLGADISSSSMSGNNVVLQVGSGTLTIKDGAFKEITFIDSKGAESTKRFFGEEYDNSSEAKVTLASASKTASASARTTAINITGNDLNNSILGGSGKDVINGLEGEDALLGGKGNDKLYGGDGDDTLIGGLGNDSLWGDSDAGNFISDEDSNTFVFNAGDGNDLITGFGENDILQFNDINIDDIVVSKTTSALVMNFDDNNSLTFKKYATDTFNINGTHYEVKGNVLKEIDR